MLHNLCFVPLDPDLQKILIKTGAKNTLHICEGSRKKGNFHQYNSKSVSTVTLSHCSVASAEKTPAILKSVQVNRQWYRHVVLIVAIKSRKSTMGRYKPAG
jgi:hypothetical protein